MSFLRPDIIRPPSEAYSYFLPLTSGCSNNSCNFCNFYGSKLQLREFEEVINEIDVLSLFQKTGVRIPGIPAIVYALASQWDGRRIFLQDGDALIYPYKKLNEILQHITRKFPGLERIASYATPQDILRISVDDLRELRKFKLGILYIGVETGDDKILSQINKGVDSQQMVEACRKVKEAGILLSVSVILGLGGIERSQQHAESTAKILTDINPDFAGALTLTLIPGTPLFELYQKGQFSLITPYQSLQELKTIIEKASFTGCLFSSMHASNYYSVRGILPQNREQLLAELNYVLRTRDSSLLRPEYMRGL